MKANCWYDKNDVRVEEVPDPKILNPRDAVLKITSSAICGSDLHLYDGFIPTLAKGDILGHEFMGEVMEVGGEVKNVKTGDRIVVPFPIACGSCFFCKRQLFSLCENTNPNAALAEKMWGYSPAGVYGYSHLLGGYAGGQAQYVRVPHVDSNHIKIPSNLSDEQTLFLSDIFPTGYMAAENCDIRPDDTVAVWGCGPVGQFAIKSAFLLGAARVIAIDRFPERLQMARDESGAETVNYMDGNVTETLKEMTGGLGPDSCIDAVGMEAHDGFINVMDRVKQAAMLESDRPFVLRQAIMACRKGGTVSIPGVYGGLIDKIPFGAAMNKALTFRMGQTHVQRYMPMLLERIERGEIDPSFVITHRMSLDEAPEGYDMFKRKEDGCIKIVLKPNG